MLYCKPLSGNSKVFRLIAFTIITVQIEMKKCGFWGVSAIFNKILINTPDF